MLYWNVIATGDCFNSMAVGAEGLYVVCMIGFVEISTINVIALQNHHTQPNYVTDTRVLALLLGGHL